jgi:hypothetical protein
VLLQPGITYDGSSAIIKRRDMTDPYTRTFTTQGYEYAGAADSKPLIIRNLVFDGNSANQGPYRGYQQEHGHLVFLNGWPTSPGRLKSLIENVVVRNSVADGISIYTNVDVVVRNVRAENDFRGGVVVTGGNSKILIENLTTLGPIDKTGIDVEVDGPGYNNSLKIEFTINGADLDGDLDIGVFDGSVVDVNNLRMRSGPVFLLNSDSKMTIRNSTLLVGVADSYANRIVAPGDLTFDNVQFYLVDEGVGYQYGLDIYWTLFPSKVQQTVRTINCGFHLMPGLKSGLPKFSFYHRAKGPTDRLEMTNTVVDPGFNGTAGVAGA